MRVVSHFSGDVLRGLQEGGNALLKRLGDFFQAPSAYIPMPQASIAPSRLTNPQNQDSEIFFLDTFAKFSEALQNADSMTFPVLDEYVLICLPFLRIDTIFLSFLTVKYSNMQM